MYEIYVHAVPSTEIEKISETLGEKGHGPLNMWKNWSWPLKITQKSTGPWAFALSPYRWPCVYTKVIQPQHADHIHTWHVGLNLLLRAIHWETSSLWQLYRRHQCPQCSSCAHARGRRQCLVARPSTSKQRLYREPRSREIIHLFRNSLISSNFTKQANSVIYLSCLPPN